MIMELIYFFINKDTFIEKEGFNLSPEYECSMKYIKEENKYYFEIKSTKKINIMKRQNVINVSALVGKNGSGKTTLMQHIMSRSCYPLKDVEGGKCEKYNRDKKEKNTTLFVTKNDEGTLIIETNIKKANICIECDAQHKDFYFSDDAKKGRDNLIKSLGQYCFSGVYLTNASINNLSNSVLKHNGIDKISFYPGRLNIICNDFFGFMVPNDHVDEINKENKAFINFSDFFMKKKNSFDFQNICDILYFKYLNKIDSDNIYRMNLIFSFMPILRLYENWNRDGDDYKNDEIIYFSDEKDNILFKDIVKWLNKNADKKISNSSLTYNLKMNYIAEIMLAKRDLFKEYKDETISVQQCYDNIIQKKDLFNNIEDKIGNYFKTAQKEIDWFDNISDDIKTVDNIIEDVEDLGYKWGFQLKYEKNENSPYYRIIDYIFKSIESTKRNRNNNYGSFILRYFYLHNVEMSSGERAYRNIMSWLCVISHFRNIILDVNSNLRKNILLCIDEIDLYMHPAWQRDIIHNLINELSIEYKDYNVQLIISTHSPLCLSDIPVENIVFLDNKNDKITPIINKHNQCFCSNIYEILNDNLYLEGQPIGKYARKCVAEWIDDIKEKDVNDEKIYEDLINKINYIGDPLIKYKLNQMIYEKQNSKVKKIEFIKKQKELLDKEIERLKNDKKN